MTGSQRTIRTCLNQILVGVSLSIIFTMGTGIIGLYTLKTEMRYTQQQIADLKDYVKDPSVCLGSSVCRLEYDSHVKNSDGRFRSIFQNLAALRGYTGGDIRRD